jgi:hypothetical protein
LKLWKDANETMKEELVLIHDKGLWEMSGWAESRISEGIDGGENLADGDHWVASEIAQRMHGQWDRGFGDWGEDIWSDEMSGVGRANCRATNAEIVHLID